MTEKRIAIYGAGGFGREVAWLIETMSMNCKEDFRAVCFIDDDESLCGTSLNGLEVLSLPLARNKYQGVCAVSGIGIPKIRAFTMQKATDEGFGVATLIHPKVEISKWNEIGEGTVICAGNILTTNITVGKQVQINLDCTIGHDVRMDDFATLAPGVHVSGYVYIGKRVYIGTGAVIINGTKNNPIIIGDDAVVGAGSCVAQSIPAGGKWVGVPACPIRK